MNQIQTLQENIENVRNICIIAHVDHGKTTLSDMLLSSNGIISQKLAGKVRYLDSRQDEQERGITMESSAISLFFSIVSNTAEQVERKDYLINLIDSPGHVDFTTEVSTASRLCDGGLLLVDVVEGVCSQTHKVLRQAYEERTKPILVLNKIDRLITELKQTPFEAFIHLNNILEQVNAILGTFEAQEILEDVDQDLDVQDSVDDEFYFAPEKGNVIFASAIDGWGFRTNQFARLYAAKLRVREANLARFMWGKYYLDPKSKRIIGPKLLKGRNLKPLFVQFVLDNIWKVYHTVLYEHDSEKVSNIVQSLQLQITQRELKSKDTKTLLQNIMTQWIPLSQATLMAVVQKIPNPKEAQAFRMETIYKLKDTDQEETKIVMRAVTECDKSVEAPVVCFISKVFSASSKDVPPAPKLGLDPKKEEEKKRLAIARAKARELLGNDQNEQHSEDNSFEARKAAISRSIARQEAREQGIEVSFEALKVNEETEVLIGFGRIYSGIIKVGSTINVLGPKYNLDDAESKEFVSEMKVERLFLMMGRELKDLEQVPAGNVFGILCTNSSVLKTATLSSNLFCPSLAGVRLEAPPILQVALEPSDPTQMQQLQQGLELLNRADPCVEVALHDTGEYVIMCAGELHLERCLKDLREKFAKIEIQASQPLVPFRETITPNVAQNLLEKNPPLFTLGVIEKISPDQSIQIGLRIVPMPPSLPQLQESNDSTVKKEWIKELKEIVQQDINDQIFPDIGIDWNDILDRVLVFGNKFTSANIMINLSNTFIPLWSESRQPKYDLYQSNVTLGFQLGVNSGPLCAEPISGLIVLLDKYRVDENLTELTVSLLGQISSMVKECIKQGFLQWSSRLMLATYSCELQTDPQYMGKVDAVLSRRRGRIVSEDIKDGMTLFTIGAILPVIESFGFVEELLKKTSGVASPQLLFNGFEVLDEDPFWFPFTEEELEDLGEKADRDNIAKKYMETVRFRKGMQIEKKLVEHGEKQRNLKNK